MRTYVAILMERRNVGTVLCRSNGTYEATRATGGRTEYHHSLAEAATYLAADGILS
ncbi:MAG TPA: hypothetical protein VGN72_24100 [Tepidisphaeraceae bacterium]|nr:hypothetical protein [Tepidisphaeraceae bacterium]